jgi:hypothetical protein
MTPEQPGEYVVTAKFAGATAHGLFSNHTAGAEAKVTITVGEGIDAGVDAPDDASEEIDAGEDEDAATVAASDVDAGPIDWPGTWKGKMKTTLDQDGVKVVNDSEVTLEVKRTAAGKILFTTPGYPPMELTPTPSNPRAANATQILPRPGGMGGNVQRWDAQAKYTAFLADGKLNLAIHLTIDQTVTILPDEPPVNSTLVSDSIGQLVRIK